MKKIVYSFFLALVCFCSEEVFANNLTVSNVKIIEQNTNAGVNNSSNYTKIQFDLNWENSWRTSTGPSNWDAAWVFVKYRVGSGVWQHAKLNTSGHTAPSGSTINTTSDGMGAFVYKDANGTGTSNFTGIKLRWNYGENGMADTSRIDVQVFAIEMVYVPQGSFYVGSGGSDSASFYQGSSKSTPFQVTSEASITIGSSSGNLNYSAVYNHGDGLGPIPADFPKGYNAYYCMKYEISQQQYVDFLNTLTYAQQNNRAAGSPTDAAGTGGLNISNLFRSGIDVMTSGSSSGATTPAVYACNFDGDGNYNESNDGQNIACNYLSYADLLAYMDWSGLRPMTELEFEKACRGNQNAVANEYAFGTSTATIVATIGNDGQSSESSQTTDANIVANSTGGGFSGGPIRTGIFATGSSTRVTSGASYYGIMELSGNLWERTVSVGSTDGRTFTGLHGDGSISATGLADVGNWPSGLGLKGGAWNLGLSSSRVSNRQNAANFYASRAQQYGGRGIRTAP